MRAQTPTRTDSVVRNGIRIHFEVYGSGEPTVLLMPTWSITYSRIWKAQIPYLARHFRVVTFDNRGNGDSDRPAGHLHYLPGEYVDDAVAVLDATDTRHAIVVGNSLGGHLAAILSALHPDRVQGAILIAPSAPFGPTNGHISPDRFLQPRDTDEGWAKFNQHYWLRDYPGFTEFFFNQVFNEPHSTKQIEDGIGWAAETTPEVLIDTTRARFEPHKHDEQMYRSIRAPVLVIHGDQDLIMPYEKGRLVAQLTNAEFVTMEGSGHVPQARDPVPINLLIREFVDRFAQTRPRSRTIRRGLRRPKRALYLSSPIGLGHARRDLAIAKNLRELRPGLQVDWLAQHPVTTLLDHVGESIHPASDALVSESRHIETEAGEHDLHAFQALRRMDEILVANFMVFQEAVEDGRYDLIIADESWDVDHFWHENPELKRGALAWFTDFVGFVPMADGGIHENLLTSDYNAEMIEHIERYPRVRDRSIFVGNREDVITDPFGPNLPGIREWTESHFDFSGYITGIDPSAMSDRGELRHRFGYAQDEKVCIASVGGSGVGLHLLRRIIQAFPSAKRRLPELRLLVVAGPRIDPRTLPQVPDVDLLGFIPDLHLHLAACDLALVQGGLTTCMELAMAKVPFLYFPLHNHFEQTVHVRHRLERYRAGRPMDYAAVTPEEIADAIVAQIGRPAVYRDVESDGALRAARLLAEII